jgi:membrane protein DedA with SNARE-associated domain
VIDTMAAVLVHVTASPKPLPGVFNSLEPTLEHYGYLAVGGFLFLENIGLPLPGETILIAASLYAANGSLNIFLVGIIAVLASTAGSCVGYAIGDYGGRPIAEKYGKYVFLTEERLVKTEEFFDKRGWLVVMLGRFVEGVRQAVGIIAGISGMRFRQFFVFTLLGATLWVATWAVIGELAGDHIDTIAHYATYVAAVAAVALVVVVMRAVIRSRRRPVVSIDEPPQPTSE